MLQKSHPLGGFFVFYKTDIVIQYIKFTYYNKHYFMKINIKTDSLMKNKGFTLIELMVVVAIIAILAAVIVAALNNAREQGDAAAIKSNLGTIRNLSGIFYSDNQNSYLPPLALGVTTTKTSCASYDVNGTNMFTSKKVIADAIAEARKRGTGQCSYYNSSETWAVMVQLKTVGSSWCVDSSGNSKLVNTAVGTIATGVCN